MTLPAVPSEWFVYHPGSREIDGPYNSESFARLEQSVRGGSIIGPYRPYRRGNATVDKTPKTRENIEHFFKMLENPKETPTGWELDFLTSIRDQFDRRGSLSDKQFEILERIYTERTE